MRRITEISLVKKKLVSHPKLQAFLAVFDEMTLGILQPNADKSLKMCFNEFQIVTIDLIECRMFQLVNPIVEHIQI